MSGGVGCVYGRRAPLGELEPPSVPLLHPLFFAPTSCKTVQADRQAGAGGGRVGLVRGPRPVRVTRKNLKFPRGPPAPRVPRGPRTRQIKGGYCTRPDHAQARGPRRHFFLQQTYGVTTGSRSPAVRWVSNEGAGGSGTRVRRPRFKNWARLVLYDSEAGCWSRF